MSMHTSPGTMDDTWTSTAAPADHIRAPEDGLRSFAVMRQVFSVQQDEAGADLLCLMFPC